MNKQSKVTKVLINKIHGGRKQDSKFWKSEFSEDNNKQVSKRNKNKRNLVEFLSLFFLSVIGIGIVIYGGYFMYNRYRVEFSQPGSIIQTPKQSQRPPQIQKRTIPKARRYNPDNKPITRKDLDRAIAKALKENPRPTPININAPTINSYYHVELMNGSVIEAKSASKNGDHLIIKDIHGMKFSLNRKDIKEVKKVTKIN